MEIHPCNPPYKQLSPSSNPQGKAPLQRLRAISKRLARALSLWLLTLTAQTGLVTPVCVGQPFTSGGGAWDAAGPPHHNPLFNKLAKGPPVSWELLKYCSRPRLATITSRTAVCTPLPRDKRTATHLSTVGHREALKTRD